MWPGVRCSPTPLSKRDPPPPQAPLQGPRLPARASQSVAAIFRTQQGLGLGRHSARAGEPAHGLPGSTCAEPRQGP